MSGVAVGGSYSIGEDPLHVCLCYVCLLLLAYVYLFIMLCLGWDPLHWHSEAAMSAGSTKARRMVSFGGTTCLTLLV